MCHTSDTSVVIPDLDDDNNPEGCRTAALRVLVVTATGDKTKDHAYGSITWLLDSLGAPYTVFTLLNSDGSKRYPDKLPPLEQAEGKGLYYAIILTSASLDYWYVCWVCV